jgi:hypothetical protein
MKTIEHVRSEAEEGSVNYGSPCIVIGTLACILQLPAFCNQYISQPKPGLVT